MDRLRTTEVARKYAFSETVWVEEQIVSADQSAVNTDGDRARRALQKLNGKQKQVVELGYFEGLSCREIATNCGIPLGTVKSRLAAGISELRRQLISLRRVS